ncbi:MAG: hypothetical protein HY284_02715 [Nitrospirae bacterium]|nr:hypothetical protein [Nitrospirota bacterium]
MDRLLISALFLLLLVVGFVRVVRRVRGIRGKKEFASEFLGRFREYFSSGGKDYEAYSWLVHRSPKMQTDLGSVGIMALYRPPFAQYGYRNYPIILNMLPELRREFADDFLTHHSSLPNEYGAAIQETLVRYLGVLDDEAVQQQLELRNPLVWLREGVRFMLLLPVLTLSWVGLISAQAVGRVSTNLLFKIVAGIVTLIGVVSGIMGIILGWEDFLKILKSKFG